MAELVELFKEVAEPSRRAILAEMKLGPKSVGELVDATGLKQPNVSNHLAKLRERGIVRATKVGRQVFYALASADLAETLGGILSPEPAGETIELNDEAVRRFARQAVGGDEQACTRMVDTLVNQGVSLVTIYQRLFTETLNMVGKWWEVKAIDEGQEHLASAVIERLMARVVQYASPAPRPGLRAVIGCSEGNWHSIGVRMISDVMRLSGWQTLYMGANVPTPAFVSAVQEHQPVVVMVSCPMRENLDGARELVGQLAALRPEVQRFRLGVGGRPVVAVAAEFMAAGADFTAGDLVDFVDRILPHLPPDARIPAEA